MGTWIEIRCERRGSGEYIYTADDKRERCFSDDNSGPQEMFEDKLTSITEGMRFLSSIAKREGWIKTRSGWVCPHCIKYRADDDA